MNLITGAEQDISNKIKSNYAFVAKLKYAQVKEISPAPHV